MRQERQNEKQHRLNGRNLLGILIDHYDGVKISGRICHRLSEEELKFDSMTSLLLGMERLYDEWNFPESACRNRSFFPKRSMERLSREENTVDEASAEQRILPEMLSENMDDTKKEGIKKSEKLPLEMWDHEELLDIRDKRGKQSTIYVLMMMRQRAAWQGKLENAANGEVYDFTSDLEFIHLLTDICTHPL